MGIWYATREDIKSALDIMETARNDSQVDRALENSSRSVEGLTHRRFYPELATRKFDWPNSQYARAYRLWLEANELISATTVVSGGVTLTDYFLRRADDRDEPPYTYVELDLSTNAAFSSGSTHQRSLSILGLYGYKNDTTPAGAVAEAVDSSETAIDVSDSALVGVGSLLTCESERMVVTGKSQLLVTTITGSSLTAVNSDVTIGVTSGPAFHTGEIITVDAERMRVVDVVGNNLVVKRAWDGSVLATHATGASIYAPRTLTVVRASLGTTAATHADTTALVRQVYPGPVVSLTVAYALNELLQESSGYARVAGSGENAKEFTGRGIAALETDCMRAVGRQARSGAI
jgi:hypothetical protein